MSNSNTNAAKLIIENIQLLEQANNLLNGELSEKIFNAVDNLIEEFVENFNDDSLIGSYDFHENETWFLSSKWKNEDFDFEDSKTWKNLYAFYELTNEGENDETNNWWLTNFFINDNDRMILNFALWKNGFNKTFAKEWKEFVIAMNKQYPQIEQLGFKFNPEGNWYLLITSLDKQTVIYNYEHNTLEDALTPITDALDKLKQAHPYFDEIVQAAIAKFGLIENEE
ncbi:hypothetical protein F4V57_09700 [Acinetobacter qingfengensis]|uniref:Uncharacterized protein n=1 Tax=Acinetobacter qingfengensis TaxID=1262585 RepID=A0A1E7RFA0_9GAMM|nr:hypothetical protein [Acinetobacter qingfengensis]KAA8732822.1 hypothetical protein F4V57_09700 [Acinetobacter qingfengensis]OEY98069.1 hypothetical protein BJI46_00640 [Acinetobacter qingfengensis]